MSTQMTNEKATSKKVIGKYSVALILTLSAGAAFAFGKGNIQLSDVNGDGVISAEEIREARQAARTNMIVQFDTNGDGELSRQERRAAKETFRALAVESYDANGDGELSRSERKTAKQARKDAIMLQLDVNGDGEVSDAEKAGWKEVRKERRGKHKHGKRNGRGEAGTEEDSATTSESS